MNDALRFCPVCGKDVCDHDERRMANALRNVGTGVSNIDLILPHRWISSMRCHGRAAIIEMKRHREHMSTGQAIALLDLTGTVEAVSGYTMQQRAFAVWNEEREGIRVFTVRKAEKLSEILFPLRSDSTWQGAARAVQHWVRSGELIDIRGRLVESEKMLSVA